jgi:hypothetical protein
MIKFIFSVSRFALLFLALATVSFSYSQCSITAITAGTQTGCDATTNNYTQEQFWVNHRIYKGNRGHFALDATYIPVHGFVLNYFRLPAASIT